MVFAPQPYRPPFQAEPVKFYPIPAGYNHSVQVPGRGVLPYNPQTQRCYDPTSRQIFHFNNRTNCWEEHNLFSPPHHLDPIAPQSMVPTARPLEKEFKAAIPEAYAKDACEKPAEAKPKVYAGREWEKVDETTPPTRMKKVATLLNFLVAGALAVATILGSYSTYALLLQQGNPVGVIVGFLTLYFGVAAYKYTQLALEKLHPK